MQNDSLVWEAYQSVKSSWVDLASNKLTGTVTSAIA
jgi:hypothetical protein